MNTLRALNFACKMFCLFRRSSGVNYVLINHFGQPTTAILFATGRDAWKVSVFASEYKGTVG